MIALEKNIKKKSLWEQVIPYNSLIHSSAHASWLRYSPWQYLQGPSSIILWIFPRLLDIRSQFEPSQQLCYDPKQLTPNLREL